MVPDARTVQLMPSGEVTIVPEFPTTTHRLLKNRGWRSVRVVPEVRAVHVMPSVDSMIIPLFPDAMIRFCP